MYDEVGTVREAWRVAIMPDSFKGSATAREVGQAIERGVAAAGRAAGVAVRSTVIPCADGGEGTLVALAQAWDCEPIEVETVDALGRPIIGRIAISPDRGIAVIEAAQSNGLPLVSDVPLRPRDASTRGVGRLIRAALEHQVEEILLCIGGSATTDGGLGLLCELGGRALDASGAELPDGGGSLIDLATLDLEGLDPRAAAVRWRVACDVTNPLTGPTGAAAVFGPQKGADAQDIRILDRGLDRLATVVAEHTGRQIGDRAGMGAAGGIPVVVAALLGGELLPGSEMVAEVLDLAPTLLAADLVITGEGRFDTQSLDGKVVDMIRRLTPAQTPVIVLAGEVAVDAETWLARGISAACSIAGGPTTLPDLRRDVLARLTEVSTALVSLALTTARPRMDPTP